jgi:hypothetical protein
MIICRIIYITYIRLCIQYNATTRNVFSLAHTIPHYVGGQLPVKQQLIHVLCIFLLYYEICVCIEEEKKTRAKKSERPCMIYFTKSALSTLYTFLKIISLNKARFSLQKTIINILS